MEDLPRFLEIADVLMAEVRAGSYPPGERFPSESDLAQRFDVSRYGIRQALDRLVQAGLIRPVQGVGYFVRRAPLRIRYTIAASSHYSREIQALGYIPGMEVADCTTQPAPAPVAAELELLADEAVHRLVIVRSADGVPISWCVTWLATALCPDLPARLDQLRSLYTLLREAYGIEPRRGRTTFSAAHFTAQDARYLGIEHPVPILSGTNLARDQRGRAVELTQMRTRGDLCYITIPFDPPPANRKSAQHKKANQDVQA